MYRVISDGYMDFCNDQFSMKSHRVAFFSEVIEKANILIFMNVFIHS